MRRVLTLLHRWLGIAGNLLFVVWFASALVMMYARMPALDPGERLNRLPPLDLDAVQVGPAAAAAAARLDAEHLDAIQVRLGMAGDRPVYRFRTTRGWTAVYADSGSPLLQVSEERALGIASSYVAGNDPTARPAETPLTYDAYLTRPDQWSLQIRDLLPLHRVRAGNDVLYVSDRTAEVVMATTPGSRFWGTAGAVFHWLYFTPLRTRTAFWYQLIVWTAGLGCVLTLSGLITGTSSRQPHSRSTTPTTTTAGTASCPCRSCGSASTTRLAPGSISTLRWAGSSTASNDEAASTAGCIAACTGSTSPASTTGVPCGTSS